MNFVVLVSIHKSTVSSFLLINLEAKSNQNLSENLLRNLKVSMFIKVLEETLSIKSVLSHKLSEISNDSLYVISLFLSSLDTVVLNLGSSSANFSIKVLLESLFGEDLVNMIAEFSPFHMFSSLWSLVNLVKLLKLSMRNWNFSHAQSHSELIGSYKS